MRSPRRRSASAPLKVAVLIDHRPNHAGEMGGLVGTWERLAQVARGHRALDLTVFCLGNRLQHLPQADNVRYVLMPPLFGTEHLPFLHGIPTHTDLAPLHPMLFRALQDFHLLHTTDTFRAFARTALWKAWLTHVPLVTSVQTDTIGWARIYAPAILRRLLPGSALTRWLIEHGYLDWQERAMEWRFGRYLRHCATVFVSHERDRERVQRLAPKTPFCFLGRGLDLETFHPQHRDRGWLEACFGVPPGRTLCLFVGRLDAVKGVMLAAKVVQHLGRQHHPVHLLVVGDGPQRQQVATLLGEQCTLTGNLPHNELARIYASADVLLMPSEAEVWPNVIMEARACGLPVVACARGAHHVMRGQGWDGVLLPGRDLQTWCRAVEELLQPPERLRDMGYRARRAVEGQVPSWAQVLEEQLMPVWQQVGR